MKSKSKSVSGKGQKIQLVSNINTNTVSLRSYLLASLSDLVEKTGLKKLGLNSFVAGLVSKVADYTEEGKGLNLDIFLTDNIITLISPVPDSQEIFLGNCAIDETGVILALKKSAPLIRGVWHMYFSEGRENAEFGIFRDSGSPLNVAIEASLATGSGPKVAKFIRISKIAPKAVRVANHLGTQVIIDFSDSSNPLQDPKQHLKYLCESITSRLGGISRQSTESFLSRLLDVALAESHGTLVAVISEGIPSYLSDCTRLKEPISIHEFVKDALRGVEKLSALKAAEDAVIGMFGLDGILIFDNTAKIHAYNAFVVSTKTSRQGGARRRAFETLCGKLGKGLEAVYYKSQDGNSDFRRYAK